MCKFRLTVQYEGTKYAGFQIQPKQRTIQGELEKALKTLAGEPIRIAGAGRTDAGVHSEGQTISFKKGKLTVPADRLPYALNRLLPRDIKVVAAELVPRDFHARYSALQKTYRYQIYHSEFPNVFWQRYALWEKNILDWEAISHCAQLFVGSRDFKAFTASKSGVKTTVRQMYRVEVNTGGSLKTIKFTADGFLYNMVRNIVGTLLDVGRGKLGPKEIEEIFQSRDRRQAGATAPPWGLFLESVK
ncbi:MAG TPA: tRNA pseudouridine(38-40) synthase TruA, partial [Firmicutes bacterium]|nr:tRNA pseudouridine(38-40) synthase TruA [Bacillota bacterium]